MRDLEHMAMFWLRFEKRCRVVLTERSPRYGNGKPDVLGITDARFLLEIEIKRSVSDFRANDNKPHIAGQNAAFALEGEFCSEMFPRQFWYLVPHGLVEKVRPLLPKWAGLLRGPSEDEVQGLSCVVKATTNKGSKRLSTKECVQLAQCMSNQIFSLTSCIYGLQSRVKWELEHGQHQQDYVI